MAQADDSWKINLKNADIREFVTQVSAITGKSFIIDPRVKGDVTVISNVNMDEESVYQLFLSVLQVHGFRSGISRIRYKNCTDRPGKTEQ